VTRNNPQTDVAGDARETRTGANPVAGKALLDAALAQLNEEPTKH
jgi:hypothetical protein